MQKKDISNICKICGKSLSGLQGLGIHLRNTHKISMGNYIQLFYGTPDCKCGCGANVKWNQQTHWFNAYINGHNGRGIIATSQRKQLIAEKLRGNKNRAGKPQSIEEKQKRAMQQIGSGNHQWKGGISYWRNTSKPEYTILMESIRKRDNYTCQQCGTKHNKRKFPVHHIIPFCFTQDNSSYNLVILCDDCHRKQKSHTWACYIGQKTGWEDWQKTLIKEAA